MTSDQDAALTKFTTDELKDMIARWAGSDRVPQRINIITDTSDFFRVDYDDVVILGEEPYLIRNCERERRFGMGDEPKFWVKKALHLKSGALKIIKMVFLERFEITIGDVTFDCARSPQKEARCLELVSGHQNFMQGFSVPDSSKNVIRIIDFIRGKTMDDYVIEIGKSHSDYFFNHFPAILEEFIELVKAIKFLHDHGEKHGDIRRDHIIKDRQTGRFQWIDFDYNCIHKENVSCYDLFGLGNVLSFLVGRGDVILHHLKQTASPVLDRLTASDLNIVFHNRVMNLKKVYPYIPDALNRILLHFSMGANIFYDDTGQLLEDLQEASEKLEHKEVYHE